jgi:thiamine pyrophosphokinase
MIALPRIGDVPQTVILANGDYPSADIALSLLQSAGRVICCDGAASEYIGRGNSPYAIVGDCDSLGSDIMERYGDIIHRDSGQMDNDLTKAMRFCIGRGFDNVTILGATGKREDHTLGNISLLADYARLCKVRMVTDRGVFDAIYEDAEFESEAGGQVSLFTLSPDTRITTQGLLYVIDNSPLTSWWQGTLNESAGAQFTVKTDGATIVYRLF